MKILTTITLPVWSPLEFFGEWSPKVLSIFRMELSNGFKSLSRTQEVCDTGVNSNTSHTYVCQGELWLLFTVRLGGTISAL